MESRVSGSGLAACHTAHLRARAIASMGSQRLATLFRAHKCHASGVGVRGSAQLCGRAAAALYQVQACCACMGQKGCKLVSAASASQACTPLLDGILPQLTLEGAAAKLLLRVWRMFGSWTLAATSQTSMLQRCVHLCRTLPEPPFSSLHAHQLVPGLHLSTHYRAAYCGLGQPVEVATQRMSMIDSVLYADASTRAHAADDMHTPTSCCMA